MTRKEVAALLGVGEQYIYDQYAEGKLQGRKISERKLRFTPEAVAEFQARRSKGTGASSEAAPAPPRRESRATPAQGEPVTSIPDQVLANIYEAREWAVRTADTVDALTKAQIRERLRKIAELLPEEK